MPDREKERRLFGARALGGAKRLLLLGGEGEAQRAEDGERHGLAQRLRLAALRVVAQEEVAALGMGFDEFAAALQQKMQAATTKE